MSRFASRHVAGVGRLAQRDVAVVGADERLERRVRLLVAAERAERGEADVGAQPQRAQLGRLAAVRSRRRSRPARPRGSVTSVGIVRSSSVDWRGSSPDVASDELLRVRPRRVGLDAVGVAAAERRGRAPEPGVAARRDGAARVADGERRPGPDHRVGLDPPQRHAQRVAPLRAVLPAVRQVELRRCARSARRPCRSTLRRRSRRGRRPSSRTAGACRPAAPRRRRAAR